MNQKLAIGLLVGGLATFLTSLAEFFSTHTTWSSMSAPNEIAHIITMTATFCMIVAGALGTQLPRDKDQRVGDRMPKDKIVATIIESEVKDSSASDIK